MTIQLPPVNAYFVNRFREQEAALEAMEDPEGPLFVRLSGAGGLGKTELAATIARKVRFKYPDGVFWVDLDDYRVGGAVDLGDVLGQLLRSLGAKELAPSFKARCRQYWELTADKRMIVVVDNARYASEVAPLAPSSPMGVVIVASHGPLYGLADGAAVDLPLAPLEEAAAMEMLERMVPARRLAADREAALALVRLCAGLPAALRMVGAWVSRHQLRPLSRLVAELSAELRDRGVPEAEPVWDAAYGSVDPDAALLYRLLAGTAEVAFTRESAAALLGQGRDVCEEALEQLGSAGLLDLRGMHQDDAGTVGDAGRIRLPDYQRGHGLRRADLDAATGELAAAHLRLVRWTLRQAQRADRFAAGTRLVVADPIDPVPGAPDVPLEDPDATDDKREARRRKSQAARWLYTERHLLSATVRLASAREWDTEAWALSEPVWTYFLDHPHQMDVTDVFRTAVEAAVRTGNAAAIVRTSCQLARRLWETGRTDEAAAALVRATAALGLLGNEERDRKLKASVVEFRGMLDSALNDWDAAARAFVDAREQHRSLPNPYGVMLMTYRLGQAQFERGELAEAERLLVEAHAKADELGRARMTARTGFALGHVLRRLGRPAEARPLYQESLEAARERESDADEARVLVAFAELADEEGQSEEAERHREAARAIRRRSGLA
jgi:tetratricopeptide (TPR) repeat protein